MTFDTVPFVIDATTVDGEVIRRAIGSLINPAGGVVTAGDLQVTQNGMPNMTVNIGLGQIWVPGSTTATQGPYYSRNGSSISQAINAADPTNPRIDTLGVQVQDAAYAGALKQLAPFYVPGTATAGANLTNLTGKGAVPASSYVLAYVEARAGTTSILTSDILNVATPAALNLSYYSPLVVPTSGSVTAKPGQLIVANPGATITLPSNLTSPAIPIKIFASTIVTATSPVTVNGSVIVGPGFGSSGVSSFTLGMPFVAVELIPENGNWVMTSGQQDTGWVAITLASGFTGTAAFARLRGDTISLKGGITNGTGATVAAGTTLGTMPAFAAPAAATPLMPLNNTGGALSSYLLVTGTTLTWNSNVSWGSGATTLPLAGAGYPLS